MTHAITTGLLWFAAIGSGLLAGLYFAFSTFINSALGRIETPAGIAAMNSINVVIVRLPFMPLFLGSSLAALIRAGIALLQWHQPGSVAIFAGGVIYVVGMFVCTMVFNVPLNNALLAVDPASANGAAPIHDARASPLREAPTNKSVDAERRWRKPANTISLKIQCFQKLMDFSGTPWKGKWCPGADSNHRHADFQSAALPTELSGHPGRRSPQKGCLLKGGVGVPPESAWVIARVFPLSSAKEQFSKLVSAGSRQAPAAAAGSSLRAQRSSSSTFSSASVAGMA